MQEVKNLTYLLPKRQPMVFNQLLKQQDTGTTRLVKKSIGLASRDLTRTKLIKDIRQHCFSKY